MAGRGPFNSENQVSSKCSHTALSLLRKSTGNTGNVFDGDLVPLQSVPNLTINDDFFGRARELSKTKLKNFEDVEQLIKKFDSSLKNQNLIILKRLYDRDHSRFIESIKIVQSLASKYLCCMPRKLLLLVQGKDNLIYLSQFQIACILANLFFGNEPYRIGKEFDKQYPYVCFRRLFITERQSNDNLKLEKLKFIFLYFRQLNETSSNGAVSFARQVINKTDQPDWARSKKNMAEIEFSTGKIEDGVKKGYCEVDFANEMIGGGVLGQGAVQEEIRFLMSPELIISRLFTQKLLSHEAVVITGAQTFGIGDGYSRNFRFKERYNDKTKCDRYNRRLSQIIAIDSLCYNPNDVAAQFEKKNLDRELIKASAGFKTTRDIMNDTIATGKWGCGAFNGDPYLKCVIQMLAASEADRKIVIYTFNDQKLCRDMNSIYRTIREKNLTVGDIYQYLLSYQKNGAVLDFLLKIKKPLDRNTLYYRSVSDGTHMDVDPPSSTSTETSKKKHKPEPVFPDQKPKLGTDYDNTFERILGVTPKHFKQPQSNDS